MTGIMEEKAVYGIVLSILIHILIIAVPFKDEAFKTQRTAESEIRFLISPAEVVSVDKSIQPGKDNTEKPVVERDAVSKKEITDDKKTELITEAPQERNMEMAETEEPEDTNFAEDREVDSIPLKKEIEYEEVTRTADINESEDTLQQESHAEEMDSPLPERREETIASFNSNPGEPYIGEFGRDNGPKFLKRAPISYPVFARRLGREGKVILRLSIDEKGRLNSVEVVSSEGFGFDKAAVEAINRSTFLPAMRGGKAVKSEVLLTVKFELRGRED